MSILRNIGHKISANGKGLGEGGEFENRQPKLSTNVDRNTNVQ